ncbi:MAG: hypothetical protein SGBAC_008572 [Bacillariaceae sp.]
MTTQYDEDIVDDASLCSYEDCSTCSTIYNDERTEEEYYYLEERPTTIRFSEEVMCKGIITRSEITAEEAIAAWYSHEEKENLIRKYSKTVERRRSGKKPKKNSSYRGLETFDDTDAMELQQTIETCVDAVLLEQHRQWTEDDIIIDWEAFAAVSMECSQDSMELALEVAQSDAREAKKAYRRMSVLDDSFRSLSSTSVEPTQDITKLLSHKTSQSRNMFVRSVSPVREVNTRVA